MTLSDDISGRVQAFEGGDFPKEQHLFLKKDIDSLVKTGSTIFKYPLKVYYKQRVGSAFSRAMFSVPKRNFKRAVARNLMKRRLREAFRLNRQQLGEVRVDLFFIFVGKELCAYERVVSRMEEVFSLISRQCSIPSAAAQESVAENEKS